MLLSSEAGLLIFLLLFAWLAGLTFFGFRFFRFFKKLTEKTSEKDLKSLLEEILGQIKLINKEKEELKEGLKRLDDQSVFNLQKVGLVRFNPFSDTGGNQSFVLALLDGNDNGLVITGLHSREQTRIFTKPVEKGKELGYEFSKEEIEAIVKAKKSGNLKKN